MPWPDDLADAVTPVAGSGAEVTALATSAPDLATITARSSVCRACPRLVAWRERVATERRRAFTEQTYWGRPVPGWGSNTPWLLIVGLAPAAHGGNRTGRIFTGDRSGDWIFAALHRAGLAALPTSVAAGDGQRLDGARIVAAVRCAPPENKPTPPERDACAHWLDRELALCAPSLRAVLALGSFGWDAFLGSARRTGWSVPRPKPRFGHGAEVELPAAAALPAITLLGSYHVSQQNTFTGRLTEPMLDAVLSRALAARGAARGPIEPKV